MRSGKKKPAPDINSLASFIVGQATGQSENPPQKKNPAAVSLGRLGGLKGGVARRDKLSKERRAEIAREAARARWRKKPLQP